MKAVILSGGQGTRLRSVTHGEIPKPMAPIGGKPVLEYAVERLAGAGIKDICCTLQCLPDVIEGYFGDGRRWGVRMHYHREEEPMGTAGAVRCCADFVGSESFLVLSGDALFDFDLRVLTDFHTRRGGRVTMALYSHAAPLSYGLAVTDAAGRIRCFLEKPDWSRVVTDLVNTGIYVLEPSLLAEIPPDRPSDFSKDIFPQLLRRGETLWGLPMKGYWRDIGEPEPYYEANLDVLRGRFPTPRSLAPLPAPARMPDARHTVAVPTARRAALMRELSALLMESGADFSDGITLREGENTVHIAPDGSRERLLVSSDSAAEAERYGDIARWLEKSGRRGAEKPEKSPESE